MDDSEPRLCSRWCDADACSCCCCGRCTDDGGRSKLKALVPSPPPYAIPEPYSDDDEG